MGVFTDQEYQLYITDSSEQTVGEFLTQPPSAPLNYPNHQTFSLYNNAVNFCPPEDNGVYRLKDGKMEERYRFDFGDYSITDEYYKKNVDDLTNFFTSNSIANKEAFFENDYCAILFVTIQGAVELEPLFVVGILDKRKDIWKWFNLDWKKVIYIFVICTLMTSTPISWQVQSS